MSFSRTIKVRSILSLFLAFISFLIVHSLMDFDRRYNADYFHYENNYKNDWWQFELGFEYLAYPFKVLNLSFEHFYSFVLVFIIFMLYKIYKKPLVILFAFPNLVLFSQTLLATQIRYSIASLVFIYLFKKFYNSKFFYLIGTIALSFHFGLVLVYLFSLYQKVFINVNVGFRKGRNLFFIIFFIVGVIVFKVIVEYLLLAFGYYYYVGTDYNVGRSLTGLLYLVVVLLFLTIILFGKRKVYYPEFVFLAFFVVFFSFAISDYTVLSGRYYKFYILIEPFIIYSLYKQVGSYYKGLPFFILFLIAFLSKLLTLKLVW
ncbi:EpsG family protein [Pseudoalteromonas phenolica]|uniref:EpsG family protein n=1 Tax=Pseudoalteromonas phenolica TaxID=161398 RepID=UPI00110BC8C8|nr:EpsG family protein [Pseudoalteromonas phenolica]TMO52881.1 hypothetical protein CWC21_21455 [Pseudoalteromonas phenolica]